MKVNDFKTISTFKSFCHILVQKNCPLVFDFVSGGITRTDPPSPARFPEKEGGSVLREISISNDVIYSGKGDIATERERTYERTSLQKESGHRYRMRAGIPTE